MKIFDFVFGALFKPAKQPSTFALFILHISLQCEKVEKAMKGLNMVTLISVRFNMPLRQNSLTEP